MWSRYVLRLTDTRLGSAVVGVLATAAVGVMIVALSTLVLGTYGFALFVATPAFLGFFSALAHGLRSPRSSGDAIAVGSLAVALASLALIAASLEGAICVVMALPLTLGLGVIGALAGHAVQQRVGRHARMHALSMIALLPLLMGAESAAGLDAPRRAVTTDIVVDAPPSVVWRYVVAVERLPEPRELIFRVGVAYPMTATLEGTGVGAVRRCTFSTGDFVEPITVWQPGRRLEFRVTSQPPPMRKLSPWPDVHAPHLDGFLRSERGRFDLIALPNGRTLLRGTSWYRNRMWPQPYWGFIADELMHRIHRRVLEHVARLAETSAQRYR